MQSDACHLGVLRRHVRKPTATIYIRQSRFTKTILESQDYYTLSVLPVSYKPKESYMGSHSGRDGDKFEGSGLTPCFIGDEAAAVRRSRSHPCMQEDLLA